MSINRESDTTTLIDNQGKKSNGNNIVTFRSPLVSETSDLETEFFKPSVMSRKHSNDLKPNVSQTQSSIAITALALIAIASISTSVYLEMLMVGVAVGACCLVAAAIVYTTSRPASLVENSLIVQASAKSIDGIV